MSVDRVIKHCMEIVFKILTVEIVWILDENSMESQFQH